MKEFVTFRLGDEHFAVDILYVREIIRLPSVTPVPGSPEDVHGLINLRGQVVTILDFGARLGLAPRKTTLETHGIILKTDNELALTCATCDQVDLRSNSDPAGLAVDAIGDIFEAKEGDLEPLPANIDETRANYLDGVSSWDGNVYSILDVSKILGAD